MKNTLCILIFAFQSFIFLSTFESNAADLKAGTAITNITAPIGYPMAGYAARKENSKGIHDSLYARVLLLKSDSLSLAIVTCDLAGFYSEKVVREAKKRWGINYVMINCSHTHSGPMAKIKDRGNYELVKKDPWFMSTEDKIITAIGAAYNSLFPARVSTGAGSVLIGYNRRQIDDNGKVTMLWRVEGKQPTYPVDPTVGVIKIEDDSGKPKAVLIHYSCHAVVLGADNLLYSADYPGYMINYIQKELGNDCMGFFLQGAAGDINPFRDKKDNVTADFKFAEEAGAALGKEAVTVVKNLKPTTNTDVPLKVKIDSFSVPYRFEPEKTAEVCMITVLINNSVALVGIPGEPFVEHQINLSARSHVDNTFLLGYTTIGAGAFSVSYLPTIKAALEGGYGASYATLLEVGAGERIVDQAVITIYELLGMLKGLPTDLQ